MRSSKEILDSLNTVYSVDNHEYHDGLSVKQCSVFIIDNYLGIQLLITDILDDNDVIRYDVDFLNTCKDMYLDGYTVESEHELEDIINGFTG